MKKAFIVLAVVLMASTAWAAPFLVCDPQEAVVGYEIRGIGEPVTWIAQQDGSLKYDLTNLANGTYTVSVAACNIWGCGDSVPFVIAKQVPARPAGVRLVAK